MNNKDLIVSPVITERSLAFASKNKYIFRVVTNSSKQEIAAAVEKLFGVEVISVKTLITAEKPVRAGRKRLITERPSWKKAIVTVKEGGKIGLFDLGS